MRADRMAKLLAYPTMAQYDADFLREVLSEAEDAIRAYCRRTDTDGDGWDTPVVRLAVIMANRLGAEGAETAKEGGIERRWSEGDIPSDIKAQVRPYRRAALYGSRSASDGGSGQGPAVTDMLSDLIAWYEAEDGPWTDPDKAEYPDGSTRLTRALNHYIGPAVDTNARIVDAVNAARTALDGLDPTDSTVADALLGLAGAIKARCYTKQETDARIAAAPHLTLAAVDELPEEGDPLKVYLVPDEDGEEGDGCSEYIWTEGAWELVGHTRTRIAAGTGISVASDGTISTSDVEPEAVPLTEAPDGPCLVTDGGDGSIYLGVLMTGRKRTDSYDVYEAVGYAAAPAYTDADGRAHPCTRVMVDGARFADENGTLRLYLTGPGLPQGGFAWGSGTPYVRMLPGDLPSTSFLKGMAEVLADAASGDPMWKGMRRGDGSDSTSEPDLTLGSPWIVYTREVPATLMRRVADADMTDPTDEFEYEAVLSGAAVDRIGRTSTGSWYDVRGTERRQTWPKWVIGLSSAYAGEVMGAVMDEIDGKQGRLTAGTGIDITDGTISATDYALSSKYIPSLDDLSYGDIAIIYGNKLFFITNWVRITDGWNGYRVGFGWAYIGDTTSNGHFIPEGWYQVTGLSDTGAVQIPGCPTNGVYRSAEGLYKVVIDRDNPQYSFLKRIIEGVQRCVKNGSALRSVSKGSNNATVLESGKVSSEWIVYGRYNPSILMYKVDAANQDDPDDRYEFRPLVPGRLDKVTQDSTGQWYEWADGASTSVYGGARYIMELYSVAWSEVLDTVRDEYERIKLPAYTASDADKVLSVDSSGGLSWTLGGGGSSGGTWTPLEITEYSDGSIFENNVLKEDVLIAYWHRSNTPKDTVTTMLLPAGTYFDATVHLPPVVGYNVPILFVKIPMNKLFSSERTETTTNIVTFSNNTLYGAQGTTTTLAKVVVPDFGGPSVIVYKRT